MANSISRRRFLQGTAVLVSSAVAGFTNVSLSGCAQKPESNASEEDVPQGDISLTITDTTFSVNDGEPVAYFAEKLSLMPSVADNAIMLAYSDQNGEPTMLNIGEMGKSVSVHGTIGMLTADGIANEGNLVVEEDANIQVLSLGSLEHADVEGNVGCLIVVGSTSAKAHEGAVLQNVVTNPRTGKIEKVEGGEIGSAYSPSNVLDQNLAKIVSEDEKVIEGDLAVSLNRVCLEVFGDDDPNNNEDWKEALEEGVVPTGTKAAGIAGFGNLFAPAVAFAEEDASDDAPDAQDGDDSISDASDASDDGANDGDTSASDDSSDPSATDDDPDILFLDDDEFEKETGMPAIFDNELSYEDADDVPFDVSDDVALQSAPPDASLASVPYVDAEDDVIDDITGGTDDVLDIFKAIAESAFESIGGQLGDIGWNIVFGGNDTSKSLARIEAKLGEIEQKVDEILSKLIQLQYALQINNYLGSYGNDAKTLLQAISSERDVIDGKPEDQRADANKQFAIELLAKDSRYKAGDSTIDMLVLKVGNAILETMTGTGTNLVGAMDGLMLSTNKWEHLGYAAREAFQKYLMGQFLSLAGYAEFALRVNIENAKQGTQDYNTFLGQRAALFRPSPVNEEGSDTKEYQDALSAVLADPTNDPGIVAQVQMMYNEQRCVRRDDSQRYYQVSGHEMLLAAQVVSVETIKKNGNNQRHMVQDAAGHHVLSKDQFKMFFDDYKQNDIESIFYSEDEGNFGKPEHADHWNYIMYDELNVKKDGPHSHGVYAPIVSYKGKFGETNLWWEMKGSQGVHDVILDAIYVLATGKQEQPNR